LKHPPIAAHGLQLWSFLGFIPFKSAIAQLSAVARSFCSIIMSTFGTLFRVTTYGESHCASVGAIIDGCPPVCVQPAPSHYHRSLMITRDCNFLPMMSKRNSVVAGQGKAT
jgi:hypothetical protein